MRSPRTSIRRPPLPPRIAPDDIGTVVTETVTLRNRTLQFVRPRSIEDLCRHPAVRRAFSGEQYIPYWADLWPSARVLADHLLGGGWPVGTRMLELGCGLGLPGVAALATGLDVTFSDFDPTALEFAARNAELNGFQHFKTLVLDIRVPPRRKFPLILAADVLYESSLVEPLVVLLEKMLSPGGTCLLVDQDRDPAPLLRRTLSRRGLPFVSETLIAEEGEGGTLGTLYTIRAPAGAASR